MNTIEHAKEQMKENNLCFLALKSDSVIMEKEYRPGALLSHVQDNKHCLSGSVVAANAIGRAEALLLIYGGIKEIHANTITVPAVQAFRNRSIKVHYDNLVDAIPAERYPISAELEQKCLDIRSPFEAYGMLNEIFSEAAAKYEKKEEE